MTEVLTAPKHAAKPVFPALTGHDRCDRCNAQAYVRVALDDLELLFCGHHYTDNEVGLLTSNFAVVTDQRSELLQKPGASA